MTLWLKVTTDKYELPLVVASSRGELARLCNIKPDTITQMIAKYAKRGSKCPYIKVDIAEVEND